MGKSTLLLGVAGFALALSMSQAAHANGLRGAEPITVNLYGQEAIVNANNQIGVGVEGNYLNYLETTNSGAKFDSEEGWQPGISVSGALMQENAWGKLYIYGQFSWHKGSSHYIGGTNSNPTYGSLVGTDGASITNEDVRVGEGFGVGANVMLTPYFGAGARQWSRDLTGATGYHEDYSHAYLGGGLLVQYTPAPNWVLSANGLVGSTFNATMAASQNGGAAITPATYNLGRAAVYKVGVSADYAITHQLHANLGLDYAHFDYGRSNIINSTQEPDSGTSEVTITAGVGFGF